MARPKKPRPTPSEGYHHPALGPEWSFWFPLLPKREGDRTYPHEPYELSAFFSMPTDPDGTVRLELEFFPGADCRSGSQRVYQIPMAITWNKSDSIPDRRHIASAVWEALTQSHPRRTRQDPRLDRWPLHVRWRPSPGGALTSWRGELFTWSKCRQLLPALPQALMEQQIQDAMRGYERLFLSEEAEGRLRDPREWIYRTHLYTALFVAREVATLLLGNDAALQDVFRQWREQEEALQTEVRFGPTVARMDLLQARAILEGHVRGYVGSHKPITDPGMAMALVDAQFEYLYHFILRKHAKLLDPGRKEPDPWKIWADIFPANYEEAVEKLRPAGTVFEVWRLWAKDEKDADPNAPIFCYWFSRFLEDPLTPLDRKDQDGKTLAPRLLDFAPAVDFAARLMEKANF